MKNRYKKNIIFILLLFFLLIYFNFVFAQRELEVDYPDVPGAPTPTMTGGIPNYIKYIFNSAIALSGLLAFIVLLWSGIQYFTSAGDEEKMKNAKKQISAVFLGTIILLFSYLILITINPQLISFQLPGLPQIPQAQLPQTPISPLATSDLLGRIKEMARTIRKIPDEIKSMAEKIQELTNNCDCANTQPLCICTTSAAMTKDEISKAVFGLEYDDFLEIVENHPESPIDVSVYSSLDVDKLRDLTNLRIPGTNTYIYLSYISVPKGQASYKKQTVYGTQTGYGEEEEEEESEYEKKEKQIVQAIEDAKDVYTPEMQVLMNEVDIFILDNDDFTAKFIEAINKDLEAGNISQETADFKIEQVSFVTAYYDDGLEDGENVIVMNKDTVMKAMDQGLDPAGTFAHEYAHAIDSAVIVHYYSSSPEYQDIYNSANSYYWFGERVTEDLVRPKATNSGFVSEYARSSSSEDFAETVKLYQETGGDPSKITDDLKSQDLIQERFDFLIKNRIVEAFPWMIPLIPFDFDIVRAQLTTVSSRNFILAIYNSSNLSQIKLTQISNPGRSSTGSCQPIRCYAGPGFQPCPDETEIKENQKRIIAWKDEILYYRSRVLSEAEDLKDSVEKILNEEISWYNQKITAEQELLAGIQDDVGREQQQKLINYLIEQRDWLIEERDYKEDLKQTLNELADKIEEIEPFISEIGTLPDKCLYDEGVYGVNNKCQASCKQGKEYGCHDAKEGCQPDECSGGNPCPVGEINDQLLLIQGLQPQIINKCDKIISIIDNIRETKEKEFQL